MLDINVVIPRYAEITTTMTPSTRRTVGWEYFSPIMDFFFAAIRQIPRVMGRIRPFKAPASTKSLAGCPKRIIITVDTAMNPIITQFSFLSMAGWKVFKKDTEV